MLSHHLYYVFLQTNYTAMHYAAYCGNNNIIMFLINHGAEVDDVNDVS